MNRDSHRSNPAVVIVISLAFICLLVMGVAIVAVVGLYSTNRSARDHATRLQMEKIIMQKKFAESRQKLLEEPIERNEHQPRAEITPDATETEFIPEDALIEIDVDEAGVFRISQRAINIASLRARDVDSQHPKVLIHVDKRIGTDETQELLDYINEIEIADIEVKRKEQIGSGQEETKTH